MNLLIELNQFKTKLKLINLQKSPSTGNQPLREQS